MMAFLRAIMLVVLAQCMVHLTTAFLMDACFAPPPCTCYPYTVDCQNLGLNSVPSFSVASWNDSYLNLFLMGNNLTRIENNAFYNIDVDNTSDVDLYLQDNSISSLSDQCFNGIEDNIYSMNLTNNKLTYLPKVFGNLTNLRKLYLNENPLRRLDLYTINKLGRYLNTLEIGMSHFASWPVEFNYLRRLVNIVLYDIPFRSLRYDSFKGFENTLISLSIINSKLEELPLCICHLRRLNEFKFESNDMIAGNAVHTEPCHIDVLNWSRNMILSFKNNSLLDFPEVLRNGSSYRKINIGYNQIKFIHEENIANCRVTDLFLDHNELTRIPYGLSKLTYLSTLDLSFNKISMIEHPDLSHLTQLYRLSLASNNIDYISTDAFTSNQLLWNLDLSNNNLKTIPEALALAPSLRTIVLSNNPIDCSCLQFDIGSWDLNIVTINGNCEYGTETLISYLFTRPSKCFEN